MTRHSHTPPHSPTPRHSHGCPSSPTRQAASSPRPRHRPDCSSLFTSRRVLNGPSWMSPTTFDIPSFGLPQSLGDPTSSWNRLRDTLINMWLQPLRNGAGSICANHAVSDTSSLSAISVVSDYSLLFAISDCSRLLSGWISGAGWSMTLTWPTTPIFQH